MTIKFHFRHEGGVPRGTVVPNNLLLAYRNARKDKMNSIAQAVCFILLCNFLAVNSVGQYLPIMGGIPWLIICLIGCVLSSVWMMTSVFWKGPWATLLFIVMNTDDFEDYITECIRQMERMLEPKNRAVTFLPESEARKISKELMTAEIIQQLREESDNIADFYETINFIADNCGNLKGFIIKEVKNYHG